MAEVNWDACYALWREFEGLRLEAYPDPATGNEPWTIGYGHTGSLSGQKVKKGMKITQAKAEKFMVDDLAAVLVNLKKIVNVELNPNQWAALISFGGNVKWSSVKGSSVIKYINESRFNEVPGRMALYRLGAGKVMTGLVRRRAAEASLWLKPIGDTTRDVNKEIKIEVDNSKGVKSEAAPTAKPFDWGVVGMAITGIAGFTDEVKKILTDLVGSTGVPPLAIVGVLILGFGGWTLYNKWKQK